MKTVLIFAKRDPAAKKAAEKLKDWLRSKKIGVMDATDTDGTLTAAEVKDITMAVIIGGDGTFLTLVRRLERKDAFPIMGVNLGTLGFITEIAKEDMISSVEAALDGSFEEATRKLMEVELWRGQKLVESGTVFNDAVLNKDARTSMLKFKVRVGDEFLSDVRADGYIVSTPTGSTAYSLSVGGPLVHPGVDAIILVPLCAHSLSARPVILPRDLEIEIQLEKFEGAAYLVYDGQVNHAIQPGDTIRLRTAKGRLRLFRASKQNWYATLRSKLQMA